MLPRDSRQEAGKTWGSSSGGGDVPFNQLDGVGESGGLISGFSGAASYTLALAAVATLLEDRSGKADEKSSRSTVYPVPDRTWKKQTGVRQ